MSKRYNEAFKLVDKETFGLSEAFLKLDSLPKAKFDESVDVAIRLGVDPKKSDQLVRGSIGLPNGLGKTIKILVFAKGAKAEEATAAGADFVGSDDLVEKIQGGWTAFDTVIATPDMMAQVSKVGRILGPRGLMPNPKLGTVTNDVTKAVTESKAGKVEFRVEKSGIIHAPIGRSSFGAKKLEENFKVLLEAVQRAKPSAAKGQYLCSITISSTMGPGIALNTVDLSQ